MYMPEPVKLPTAIQDLLEKYLAGACSPEEVRQVRKHMADPALEQALDVFMQAKWAELPEGASDDLQVLSKERYSRIQRRIGVRKAIPFSWYYAAAASVLCVMLAGAAYIFRADVLDIIDPIETITYSTAPGQQLSVRLPDGSRVWMNTASSLSFPEKFRGDTRHIYLSGEAFFEVAHDEKKPFFVHAGSFYTRVLGTSFNIKAYPKTDEPIYVTVATGKVAVGVVDSLEHHRELTRLTPNHRVLYDRMAHTVIGDSIAVGQVSAWREGRLVFRQAGLQEMVSTLERWYGVSIAVQPPTTSTTCSFTADYYAGISLRDVLEALQITGKIAYTLEGNKVVIHTQGSCR